MNRELLALLFPDGRIDLEWQEKDVDVNKSQTLLQEEIFDRFVLNPAFAMLCLGFLLFPKQKMDFARLLVMFIGDIPGG